MNEKTIVPTKEEVITLLQAVISQRTFDSVQTVGYLVGMKLIDSLLPKTEYEPDWGYEGLQAFFTEHGIHNRDTLEEALQKLKSIH